jgi:hypothetical protein
MKIFESSQMKVWLFFYALKAEGSFTTLCRKVRMRLFL